MRSPTVDVVRRTDAAGQHVLGAFHVGVLARIRAARGDHDRVVELVEQSLAGAQEWGVPPIRMFALHARGLDRLAAGRSDDAIRDLLEVEQVATRVGFVAVASIPYGPDLVEALVRSGRREEAIAALGRHEERARRNASPWGLATLARCQATLCEDPDNADAPFARAVARHPPGSFDEACTRLCWGEHLRRRRDRKGARMQLEQATAVFDTLGAEPSARRCGNELVGVGVRVGKVQTSRLAELTAKELQVAMAVASGLSSREAAAALFVSPKTVEFHLGRVYSKLRVATRTQLAAILPAGPEGSNGWMSP